MEDDGKGQMHISENEQKKIEVASEIRDKKKINQRIEHTEKHRPAA